MTSPGKSTDHTSFLGYANFLISTSTFSAFTMTKVMITPFKFTIMLEASGGAYPAYPILDGGKAQLGADNKLSNVDAHSSPNISIVIHTVVTSTKMFLFLRFPHGSPRVGRLPKKDKLVFTFRNKAAPMQDSMVHLAPEVDIRLLNLLMTSSVISDST